MRVTTFGADGLAESTIKTFVEHAMDRSYLEARSVELLGLLRRAAAGGGRSGLREMERMGEIGRSLYEELVPPSLRSKVESAAGGDLLLSMDKELVHLPWELLHDGTGFLCRRYRLGRIVNVPPSLRRRGKKEIVSPVTVLSVGDPTGDLAEAGRETLEILTLLLGRPEHARPVALRGRVKTSDFLDVLKGCDVLHFAGHVAVEGPGPVLRFADGSCPADRLARVGGGGSFPRLVFLNGCRSAPEVGGGAAGEEIAQDRAFSLASAFLLSGARIFIGTLWNVADEAAARAGVAFFQALFGGRPVGAALAAAREELVRLFGESTPFWAGYVLYGDPAFRVVEAPWRVERLLEGMQLLESLEEETRAALESPDPVERFVGLLARSRIEEAGRDRLQQEGTVLFELLESSDPVKRRLGERLCRAAAGTDFGFAANAGEKIRREALDRVRRWWAAGGAAKPIHPSGG